MNYIKRSMKQIIVIMSVILILVSMLSACGNQSTPAAQEAEQSVATSKEPQENKPEQTAEVDEENTNAQPVVDLEITGNEMYDESGRREIKFDTQCASVDGVEIWEDETYKSELRTDGILVRKLLIKNTTDSDAYVFISVDRDQDIQGAILNHIGDFEFMTHPNGTDGYVAPHSEQMVEVDFAPSHFEMQYTGESQLDITIHAQVSVNHASPKPVSFVLSNEISMYRLEDLSDTRFKKGVVSGTIHDENGNPIEGAMIIAYDGYSIRRSKAKTDENGHFEILLNAFKTGYAGSWKEVILEVKKDGYSARKIMTYPKIDQEITVEMSLYPAREFEKYECKSKVDLGIQGYEYGTDHQSIVAFIPFHSSEPQAELKDRIAVTAFDFDGNELFRYPLPYEVPFLFVSDDGEYVVTEVNSSDDYSRATGWKTVILNRSGEEVYSIDHYPLTCTKDGTSEKLANASISRCATLSHDNQYLMASNAEGNLWMIDWKNNEVLWDDFLHAQIRTMDFSPDGQELYVSEGNGYMHCYDLNGNIKWTTAIDSWAAKTRITQNYIVLVTKSAGDSLKVLNRKTGELLWTYPTYQNSMSLAVSPDEKYVFFGGHTSNEYSCLANSVFDLESGKIVCPLDTTNAVCGEFSKDGKKLVTLDRKGVRVYDTSDWSYLWGYDIVDEQDMSFNFSLALNEDASKIVATRNTDRTSECRGQAYFFEYAGIDENPKYDPNKISEQDKIIEIYIR